MDIYFNKIQLWLDTIKENCKKLDEMDEPSSYVNNVILKNIYFNCWEIEKTITQMKEYIRKEV